MIEHVQLLGKKLEILEIFLTYLITGLYSSQNYACVNRIECLEKPLLIHFHSELE